MALPAIGIQALKPCPLDNKGKANPAPSEGAQVVLTRLRARREEEGRRRKGEGGGNGKG